MLLRTKDLTLYSAVTDRGLQAVQCCSGQRTSHYTVLLQTEDFRLYSALTEDFRLYNVAQDKGLHSI